MWVTFAVSSVITIFLNNPSHSDQESQTVQTFNEEKPGFMSAKGAYTVTVNWAYYSTIIY